MASATWPTSDAFLNGIRLYSPRHDIVSSTASSSSTNTDAFSENLIADLQQRKIKLIELCKRSSKPPKEEVNKHVRGLEMLGEQLGFGQGSSYSGLMAGEWELLYSPEDVTRSSPFFWAFSKAFPEKNSNIFAITDSIPAPFKEVGPAIQTITLDTNRGSGELGKLVSRIQVSTLGGLAKSTMTTRSSIIGSDGLEGLKLRIDTTKPENSSALKNLGNLGELLDEQLPPFPSGEALERVRQGSSEVTMATTYCDETLRISRNAENKQDAYVWKRISFGGVSEV
eukprot:CAMPEP_0172424626 /NCGR_PEP_ID=MMETSP1064-20121228/26840_1 /TAXON_ID=202472 /ORGANISM="Aulacoseira subarctica , Strain CCAP 1002/5" /LENGTH=282 /DNA_ID=CAMNT_0013166901 /DNA_START=36 /DNA_END=884 /DNA_ORIENTATION=+